MVSFFREMGLVWPAQCRGDSLDKLVLLKNDPYHDIKKTLLGNYSHLTYSSQGTGPDPFIVLPVS